MGFGGAALAAITSLKNNSRRGDRTNYFKKGNDKSSGESTGIPVVKISEEKRKAVRDRLIAENKQHQRNFMLIFIISLVVIFSIIAYFLFF